ncbi:uncharacterized protein [Blastocystis hominis]|uniref:Major facilitator superfamily (MFS) profile domain-containing protein n=1 Tax=Blastocystis hominis TaxID=12968 RepID=D8M764_BLAHO|nr:uncharacterized protein [Blastocystis hominis]CBK23903.2 unnamed protein product [Blastocystis hominis]|eukprot:XP_012897951.1 uncharacterized protein [Blastocystis hominis]
MSLFGLSTNFYVAISLRLLWGMLDGYLGICKTVLTEVCSPDMLPITTGLIFLSMALASTAGPIVGGYLSDPEELLAPIIDRLPYLKRVPFAIPLCLCGFGSFVCCLLILRWVDETFPKEERERKKEVSEAMAQKMSGILRKRGRAESLDDEEHVMLLMSQNNYISMFKDKLTLISVLLYGLNGVVL